MFDLVAKATATLSQIVSTVLRLRRTRQDVELTRWLLGAVDQVQDICTRGDRILAALESGLTGAAEPNEWLELLREQRAAVDALRRTLERSQPLLNTFDGAAYLSLAPFADAKSGLLTRWIQQAEQSQRSTTTLFFLPADEIEAALAEADRSRAFTGDRTHYVDYLAASIRRVREEEVRNAPNAAVRHHRRLRDEVAAARESLDQARRNCTALIEAVKETVGDEVMTRLRRELFSEIAERPS